MKTRHAAFWCALTERNVEVEFETPGILGLRRPCRVRNCTAFEPPMTVACGRRCLDSAFRRQWPPPLPVYTRRKESARPAAPQAAHDS